MQLPPVALDLTRLFLAPLEITPQGIHRVELAFARHFLESWNGQCVAVLALPWGARWTDGDRARRGRPVVDALWHEDADPSKDKVLRAVKARLHGAPPAELPAIRDWSVYGVAKGFVDLFGATGFTFGTDAKALPRGTVYINVGQYSLARSPCVSWLDERPDVAGLFMLHDTIPVDHPEFCPPADTRAHWNMIVNTARHAKGLIAPSVAAGHAVDIQLRRAGRDALPAFTQPLPVPDEFLAPAEADPDLAGADYFVICGTINRRKNHLLLLNVWRELVRSHGAAVPKLVMAGVRSPQPGPAAEIIDSSPDLRDHVIEARGLSTPALKALIANARALLMPSFIEGFGLPIVEALAQSTPVLASDIPAHREAGGSFAAYISPTDLAGWRSAIVAHASGERRRVAGYKPRRWADYFNSFESFVRSF